MNSSCFRMLLIVLSAQFLVGCSLPEKLKLSNNDTQKSNKEIGKLNHPVKFTLSYARWQEEQRQLQEAAESYRVVLSKEPENLQASLGLARINMKLGKLEESESTFKEILKQAPNDPEVLDSVAQFYAEQGDWPRSLALLDQAVTLEPENDNYRYHHAVALAEFGKLQESLDEFRRVLPEAEAHYNLAVVLKRKGDWNGSEYYVLQALNLNPKYGDARKLYQDLRSSGGSHYANHESRRQQSAQPVGYQSSGAPQTPSFPGTIEYEEIHRGPFEQ